MAKPNQPRDIKPQAEEKATSANNSLGRIIAINLITTILICIIIFVINMISMQKVLNKVETISIANGTAEENETVGEEIERGLIVDMGEFTMNLADINPRRYLKVNVALELSKTDTDKQALANTKGQEASGGHGTSTGIDPMKAIEEEMNQFKPAIRDAIITTLSSKTSDELATVPGKELAKEQISEAVDAIFNGDREVMRVSFGQFIMQ